MTLIHSAGEPNHLPALFTCHLIATQSSSQPSAQHLKSGLRGELFKCLTIAREKKSLHDCFLVCESERDVNRAGRFLLRAASWTSDPGGGEGICRSGARPCTFGHYARHRLTHRAVLFNQPWIDIEIVDLRLVGIRDAGRAKHRGCARNIREPMRE